jgi:hypothetical protein
MFGGMRRSNNVSLWTGEDLEWEKEEEGGGSKGAGIGGNFESVNVADLSVGDCLDPRRWS